MKPGYLSIGALAAALMVAAAAASGSSPPAPVASAAFPGGPEAEAANRDCLGCHSADMALTQPQLSADAWRAEVDKMIRVYHAQVPAADIPAIVAYLANRNSR